MIYIDPPYNTGHDFVYKDDFAQSASEYLDTGGQFDEDGKYVHNSGKRVLVGENSFNKYVSLSSSDKNYSVYFKRKDYSLIIRKEVMGEIDQELIQNGYVKYYSYRNNKLVENTYTEEKFKELFNEKALSFTGDKIYEKNFNDTIRMKSQLVNKEYDAIVHGKKEKFSMELTTTGAGTYLKKLFKLSDVPFSAPQNIGFLRMLVSLLDDSDFICLDFFSGSASTADAVMRLNVEENYLIVCFDDNVTDEVITEIAKQQPYFFVMRDSSMASDSVATNFEQIFATYSPSTERRVL